jgi:hypothetical protein
VSERQRLAFSGKLSWVSTPLMLAGSLANLVRATGFLSPFFGFSGMALVAKWPVALLNWAGKGLWIWKALANRGPRR